MSRRSNGEHRCSVCRMHQSLCVCADLPSLATRTRLVLVMHKSEVRKTTNTGRLAAHCLAGSTVLVHGERDRPAQCPPLAGRRPLLLVPDANATPLKRDDGAGPAVTLVVPDGTWRQAAKMRRRVPWLASMPCASLPPGPATDYRLRSALKPGGLGTLEAIARALGLLEGPEVQAALERVARLVVDRTLYSRGDLPREAVFGGLPDEVQRHEPAGVAPWQAFAGGGDDEGAPE